MRLELTGRHVEIAAPVRRLVERKLARLERMLNDSALSAQVVLTHEKRVHRADVTLHARGEKFLHAVGESSGWEPSMSQAVAKIVQQANKVKGKWQERKRRGRTMVPEAEVAEIIVPPRPRRARVSPARIRMPRIFRTSRQTLKSMSVAEAAREIEANGTGIVVFRDVETAAFTVLYRRPDGELTLIETQA